MKDRVRYELRGPAAWVTLDRPNKLNAIDGPMVQALADALERAADDDAVRVIVLRGAGRAFSAGFDLEDEDAADPADRHALRAELRRDFDLIMRCWDSPKPVIAAVHGYCLGGAFELMLACDLAVAADDCRLGAPELRFGSGIVALLLPWVVGARRAREILLTATDRIDAATAERWGLVNRAVPAEHLETEAAKLALAVARSDPLAVRLTRDAIRAGCDRAGLREALADGLEACIEIEGTETEQSRRFYEIVRSQGTRAAAAWLDRQLGADELAPAQEP